jgi:hypothetical protein
VTKLLQVLGLAMLMMWWGQDPAQPASSEAQSAAPANAPAQPIAYSHKLHAGDLKLPCELCHTASRSGESLTIPQTATCMGCHRSIATDRSEIQKLAALAGSSSTIPWVRIYELPSFVTFSHKTHLNHGSTCQECHGLVATRERMFKETDISMAGCMSCHRVKNSPTDCNTCHELQQ